MTNVEAYWFQKPSVFFIVTPDAAKQYTAGQVPSCWLKLRDAFLPSTKQSITAPANVNRITRIIWLVAIILSLCLWSWLPVGIVACITLLALIIGMGLTIYEERDKRAQACTQAQSLSENIDPSANKENEQVAEKEAVTIEIREPPEQSALLTKSQFEDEGKFFPLRSRTPLSPNASIFIPPTIPPTLENMSNSNWLSSSYVPNNYNKTCNFPVQQQQQQPSLSSAIERNNVDPTLPNPVRHNSYENVDARYRRYETQPHRVVTAQSASALATSNDLVDADGASASLEISGCENYDCVRPRVQQQFTPAEDIVNKMYCDKNSYAWNETVRDRALDWRSNPNDPRNRQRELEFAQKQQSIRSLQWNKGP